MEWSILDFSVSSLSTDLLICFNIGAICSLLFLLKIVGLFVGGEGIGHQTDGNFADFQIDGDGDMDSNEAFDVFTVQSALAFGMVFGWAVLAGKLEYQLSNTMAYAIGTSLGVAAAVLSAYLMFLTSKINMKPVSKIKVPVGTEGVAYLKIPAFGKESGIVTVVVDNQSHQVKAKTKGSEIPSFAKVKVVANEPEVVVELIKE
jgi:hypothetical protein